MKREERAKQICERCSGNKECSYTSRDLKCPQYEDIMDGYDVGQEDMLDNACEWLADNLLHYWGQINANDTDEFIDNFRKAMEQ